MNTPDAKGEMGDILVVDDDLAVLQLLSNLLAENGYEVRNARNGSTALMLVQAERPDLILLDIQMPDMDGFRVCEELKRNPDTQSIPVIFISAEDDIENKVSGFEIGGVDYINKPLQEREILARIRAHLTISQLQAELIEANAVQMRAIQRHEQAQLALQESEASLNAQYQSIPIPTTTWKWKAGDLILKDYNRAAVNFTNDHLAHSLGVRACEYYRDRPDIVEDLLSCLETRQTIEREIDYIFQGSAETRRLGVKYAFVPPDQVLVHTEDITERRRIEKQLVMRLKELDALHNITRTITEFRDLPHALQSICGTLADLFEATVACIALQDNNDSNLKGLIGFEKSSGIISVSLTDGWWHELSHDSALQGEGKAAVVTDFQTMPWPEPIREIAQLGDLHSGLVVRLDSRRTDFGALLILRSEDSASFSEYEINLAETIATELAAAIENENLALKARQAAVIAERQRLARDLHDSVTQSIYSLTLLSSGWENMARQGNLADPVDSFRRLGEVAQQALREMRLLLHHLRPPILREVGLVKSLQHRLEGVEMRANIEAELVARGKLDNLPQTIEIELFNIMQEALNNSLRHAHAQHVRVFIEEDAGAINLAIEDDGRGFDPQAEYAGMGLGTMRERARSIAGELIINSEAGRGTRVTLSLPSIKDG